MASGLSTELMDIKVPLLQNIVIPISWSLKESRAWLRKNKFFWKTHQFTNNYRKFVQTDVISDSQIYTKKLDNGITMVYQKY